MTRGAAAGSHASPGVQHCRPLPWVCRRLERGSYLACQKYILLRRPGPANDVPYMFMPIQQFVRANTPSTALVTYYSYHGRERMHRSALNTAHRCILIIHITTARQPRHINKLDTPCGGVADHQQLLCRSLCWTLLCVHGMLL